MNSAAIYGAIRGVMEGRLGSVRTIPPGTFELGIPGDDDQDRARWLKSKRAPRYDVTIDTPQRSEGLGPVTGDCALIAIRVSVQLTYPLVRMRDATAHSRFEVRSKAADDSHAIKRALTWPGNLAADEDGTPTRLVSKCLRESTGPEPEPTEDWEAGLYTVELRFEGDVHRTALVEPAPVFARPPSVYVAGAAEPVVGGALIADPGEATGAHTLRGQWLRDGSEIEGATTPVYAITEADDGTELAYRATAIGSGGTATETTPGIVVGDLIL